MIPIQHTVDTPYMVGPVHCYSGEHDGELVLFDTGPPTDTGRAFLQDNLDLCRLRHVLVSHCHIDHYGQSAWLAATSGATIYLPYRDVQKIIHHDERMRRMYELLAGMGFGRDYLEKLSQAFRRGGLLPPVPEQYLIAERDLPAYLGISVLPCPGHSQSDLVYHGDDWAITGDTLLRGIFQSPLLDIDLESGGRFNNYRAYCDSIVKLAGLQGKTILPGHRQSIDSVDSAISFYITKALQRVLQLKPHIGRNSVAGIIEQVFPEMKDPFHVYLKSSEIIFMQDFLENPEPLRASLEQAGLFARVEEGYHAAVGT
ncbi:MBL fold metallo-hydrolase [Desulfofustis glycolicus]|uniref:Glyoxylase, beta-lactamase superfamily II n=1 Tax=Desulfofustis glycolicus DSM 9705 TaxID=1121409 RepID=A0A1M5YAT4_9BACT|nr:MBL fold metallo-hydrolase [Desulfofustis glycolicus]MCB2218468.1 MBL fold metallo-hydrolase [Desulfobulbaceae bacterium]SHI08964.1 Glyoxylase, beta-lactamase superfamily II [Desulfofustis glycolicus DSM 9705]